jgi:steroid delta-isomerase-like uncharacterized protein
MSEKQERVVRRMVDEVWNQGKLDTLAQLITNDYINHNAGTPIRGIDANRSFITKFRSAFPDCRLQIDEIVSAGATVVTRWRYSGTHRGELDGIAPTGHSVSGTGLTLHRLDDDDRIEEAFTNWDALGLMQQLGAVTLPGKVSSAAV